MAELPGPARGGRGEPDLLRHDHRDGAGRVRRRPGRRGRGRGRARRRRRRDERAAGQHLRHHADRAGPHRVARRHDRGDRHRQGRHHPQSERPWSARPRRRRRWADPGALRRGRRDARPGGRRVRRAAPRRSPSAARCSSLQGLGGVYEEIFLPLHGAHQAQNAAVALAAVEAFLGAGARHRQLDPETVREGFARASSPGRLERVRTAPTILLDARPQPARHGRHGHRAARGVRVQPADRGAGGARRQGRRPACSSCSSRSSTRSWCTRNSSPRAMPADELAELAVEVFGEDRVQVEPYLPDAIEAAVALAESDVDGELCRRRHPDHRLGRHRRRRPHPAGPMTEADAENRAVRAAQLRPAARCAGSARPRSRPRGWCCCWRSCRCGCIGAHLTGLAVATVVGAGGVLLRAGRAAPAGLGLVRRLGGAGAAASWPGSSSTRRWSCSVSSSDWCGSTFSGPPDRPASS